MRRNQEKDASYSQGVGNYKEAESVPVEKSPAALDSENKGFGFAAASRSWDSQCPLPKSKYEHVLMAHGGGGRLMQQLLQQLFWPLLDNDVLARRHDAAVWHIGPQRFAFTTDSYVIRPLFFPGGSIGTLAVFGTVNDLAMAGARPLYLSASFILEEGFALTDLQHIVQDMQQAALEANVLIVTGDTKVVEHGKGDGVYINTAGIGLIEHELEIEPQSVQPGDVILINGDIARHGMAIMSVREGLQFESAIESDSAPLWSLVHSLLQAGIQIHCLRDLTRGGLAAAVIEIAQSAGVAIELQEAQIPVCEAVLGACEILGFDPLYVANEGRCVVFVPADQAEQALCVMRAHPLGQQAAIIGSVQEKDSMGFVSLQTLAGASRVLDLLSGEQLPRIC